MRLDSLIHDKGLSNSRTQAQSFVIAGKVKVNEKIITKPGTLVNINSEIIIKKEPKYVGRGGEKLEGILKIFNINPNNLICFDAGASTGGFTDCLLQQGAKKVFAYDVGTNQLAWKIRSNSKVVSREKINLRYLKSNLSESEKSDLYQNIDLIVSDLSFISLTLILPELFPLLKNINDAKIIALIKPQFELKREQINKGGIVTDQKLHKEATDKIINFVKDQNLGILEDLQPCPLKGTNGNQEFFALFRKKNI